ncbi:acetyltransferase [Nocardioides albidus]|uniref:Lysine N-acyltransferase MbtK n=1 Tax=Nocardioides albidus TaxID=1517589 RepID=A0A5C4VRW6_9ACTN|nr:GNAT family N-acetyltransferase [Nocardioides albidus]TNM38612.1 acetyltransferase [Nocardioides albidus]
MTVLVRPVDPAADAPLLHSWVTQPRAVFWGMTDHSPEDVGLVYAWIQDQAHLAAYLLVVDDVPLGLVQTYDPEVDEIGEWYDRAPGDVGVHLLLADDPHRAGRTADLIAAALDRVAHLPGCRRIVFEPDARNAASIALLDQLGCTRGPLVDLRTSISEKPAQFFFLDRERALTTARRSRRTPAPPGARAG